MALISLKLSLLFSQVLTGKKMPNLKRIPYKRFICFYPEDTEIHISKLIEKEKDGFLIDNRGRGGIRILNIEGRPVVSRKYLHGGILRCITKDLFFTGKRVKKELQVMLYLKDKGFPVVEPYCAIIECCGIKKELYLLTYYEDNTTTFFEYLESKNHKSRYRIIRELAYFIYCLVMHGVYHPDLHLDNIIVTDNGKMKFLDFDRAEIGNITPDHVESMFWRLNRYVEKISRKGNVPIGLMEKTYFLRVYSRLSGVDWVERMKKSAFLKSAISRLGWFLEGMLYGNKT